jgi:hypothetical protein
MMLLSFVVLNFTYFSLENIVLVIILNYIFGFWLFFKFVALKSSGSVALTCVATYRGN